MKFESGIPIPSSVYKKPTGYWVELLGGLKMNQSLVVPYSESQAVRRQITRFSTGDKKYLKRRFYMFLLPGKKKGRKQYRVLRVSMSYKAPRNITVDIRPKYYWEDIFSRMKLKSSFMIDETQFKNCQAAYIRFYVKYKNKRFRSKCVGENKRGLKEYRVWRIK